MTDKRISELDSRTSLALADLLEVSGDPGGSPSTWQSYRATLEALQALFGNGMELVSGPNADTEMQAGKLYDVNMSGWSADRTYRFSAAAPVGARSGVIVRGSALYEVLLMASSGSPTHFLNGVAGGTEWSRVFIGFEIVIGLHLGGGVWVVEHDGRIAQKALMRLSTSAAAESAATYTLPTDKSGVWTADRDNASITTVSTSMMTVRRAGDYAAAISGQPAAAVADQAAFIILLSKNGVTPTFVLYQELRAPSSTSSLSPKAPAEIIPLAAGDTLQYMYRSSEGSRGLLAAPAPDLRTHFGLVERL